MRVYFIAGGGKTKVGISTDVARRLKSLQASSPVPLRLVHSEEGGRHEEAGLHELLKERGHHSHYEWFEGEWAVEDCKRLFSEWKEGTPDQVLTRGKRASIKARVLADVNSGDFDWAERQLDDVREYAITAAQKKWLESMEDAIRLGKEVDR